MRIGTYHQFLTNQQSVGKIQSDIANLQNQVTTGKKFTRASEAPVLAKQAEMLQQGLNRAEQFMSNINDATGILETTSTTLGHVYNSLEIINLETIKAVNDTYSETDLNTMVAVIDSAIEQIVSLSNAKHLGRYLFSGQKIETKPFDYDGNSITYNGNSDNMKINTTDFSEVVVNEGGDKYLEGIIGDMIAVRDAVLNKKTSDIPAAMNKVKSAMDTVSNKISEVGVRIDSLERLSETYEDRKINLQTRKSNVVEVDMIDTITQYMLQQNTYSATLKATSMLFRNTILDYL